MRARKFKYLISICCLVVFGPSIYAQTDQVRLRFKVDDKEVTGKFRIIFYIDGSTIEPGLNNAHFHLPNLKGEGKVDIGFIAGKHELFFHDIERSELDGIEGDLIIGTKTKPFKPEDIPSGIRPDEKLTIKYIEYYRRSIGVIRQTFYEYEERFIDMY